MRAQMQRPAARLALAVILNALLAFATVLANDQLASVDMQQVQAQLQQQQQQQQHQQQQLPAKLALPVAAKAPQMDPQQQQSQVQEVAPVAREAGQPDELASEPAGQRQGRAESSASDAKPSDQDKKTPAATDAAASPTSDKAEKDKPKSSGQSDTTGKKASSASSPRPTVISKASASSKTKSNSNSNLGTVTSTGSGGPAHYMSKHDAYSAIAEKHGALAHDAMRKSDKRRVQSSFGGIQKASGFGEFVGPIKGVGDTGLARTLGASMRSIMKSKYSVPAYVASALLGAVALLAFYESPISPLPVPPLPEPPVGRFPPEMPNLPPGTQVPFRTNQNNKQQYGYGNQRASYPAGPMMQAVSAPGNQQQQQQVFFPGSQQAQARSSQQSVIQPVGQLASQILSSVGSVKQQVAQRKSGADFEQSTLRALFGSSDSSSVPSLIGKQSAGGQPASPKMGASSQQASKASSFLSYFGFGASSPSSAPASGLAISSSYAPVSGASDLSGGSSNLLTSTLVGSPATGSSHQMASIPSLQGQSIESKAGSGSSSSSGSSYPGASLVNRFRSYFSRPAPLAPINHQHHQQQSASDQRPAASFMSNLIKDTTSSFSLPRFLSLGGSSSSSAPGSSNSNRKSSAGPTPAQIAPSAASRMSPMGGELNSPGRLRFVPQQQQVQQQQQQQAQPGSGIGLMRVAHTLLETLTSGLAQRSVASPLDFGSAGSGRAASESAKAEHQAIGGDQSPSASAISLLSGIMSTYGASGLGALSGDQVMKSSASSSQQQQSSESSIPSDAFQTARSGEAGELISPADDQQQQQQVHPKANSEQAKQAGQSSVAQQASPASQSSSQAPSSSSSSSSASQSQVVSSSSAAASSGLVRKTRSAGFEYPFESPQELAMKEQTQSLHSKAAKINNVIDFVADSYSQNRYLFNFVMNQVGLSHAVPYVEHLLASGNSADQV